MTLTTAEVKTNMTRQNVVTGFLDWCLGTNRVTTEQHEELKAMLTVYLEADKTQWDKDMEVIRDAYQRDPHHAKINAVKAVRFTSFGKNYSLRDCKALVERLVDDGYLWTE